MCVCVLKTVFQLLARNEFFFFFVLNQSVESWELCMTWGDIVTHGKTLEIALVTNGDRRLSLLANHYLTITKLCDLYKRIGSDMWKNAANDPLLCQCFNHPLWCPSAGDDCEWRISGMGIYFKRKRRKKRKFESGALNYLVAAGLRHKNRSRGLYPAVLDWRNDRKTKIWPF